MSYLRRRPRCECRAVFVRVTAPRRELNRSTIGWVVRAACDRAGLPRVGAHRLRHTAATEMLRPGRRWPRSARYFVIASRRPPRSTPRSTTPRCGRWRARGRPRRVRHERAARRRWMTTCSSGAGSGSRCPRTAACWKVSSTSSSSPARSGSPPTWRWMGAAAGDAHPFYVASAAHGRAGVRPLSGHARPGQRGPVHRPAAGAPAADRPLHLLRGRRSRR